KANGQLEAQLAAHKPTGLLAFFLLFFLLRPLLLLVLLHVFLVRIAGFAGLAFFMGGDAAFVGAFLAFGFGLFTDSLLLLFCRFFFGGHNGAGQHGYGASRNDQDFNKLHSFTFIKN